MKHILSVFTLYFIPFLLYAQVLQDSALSLEATSLDSGIVRKQKNISPNISRRWLVGGTSVTITAGSLLLLSKLSNLKYQKNFHSSNDLKGWLQMDKGEHMFISYHTARLSSASWQWTGLSKRKSDLVGSSTSLIYTFTKELMDGHSKTGVWSWGDIFANVTGTVLFASQEFIWQEQKVVLKASAFPKAYNPVVDARVGFIFGNSVFERIIKDHNSQTYWLSFNISSVLNERSTLSWLNIAIGYGAENLYGMHNNGGYSNGGTSLDLSDLKRYRQWYFAPDIDLTKIRTKNKVIKTILFVFNSVKVPTPTLEYSNHKLKGHWLHF